MTDQSSPFSFLRPPPWFIDEAQRRFVLLANHVLMQEAEAQSRLARQAGRVVEARWRMFSVRLVATPAGLLDLADASTPADLTLTFTDESPLQLMQAALRGDKPAVQIAGDVQFAAEINWLVEHVRWDLEEDLARVIGDAPAHALGNAGRRMAAALRRFVARPAGSA
jgi:ubiquinone biosynthesis protein UbiJ